MFLYSLYLYSLSSCIESCFCLSSCVSWLECWGIAPEFWLFLFLRLQRYYDFVFPTILKNWYSSFPVSLFRIRLIPTNGD